MTSVERDIERITHKNGLQLFKIDVISHSMCEQCDKHLGDHEWVDMDIVGFVVNCSEKSHE